MRSRTRTLGTHLRTTMATAVVAAAVLAVGPGLAVAASGGGSGSDYGHWHVSGDAGDLVLPQTGFPVAQVSTDASPARVYNGASTFLNAATPFGRAYGSSRGEDYLLAYTAANRAPSTTTLRFASPTPLGWGFTLGDVDADSVHITGTGPGGVPLSAAELGWQGAFNYCNGVSPVPSTCGGKVDGDLPAWQPGSSTLRGNSVDTNGASGWFRPTVPVESISFTFARQSGNPVYQIWVADTGHDLGGHVHIGCPDSRPVTLELRHADGTPVLDRHGHHVVTTTDANGDYSFPDVAAGDYEVHLETPTGLNAQATDHTVDITDHDVTGTDFSLTCPPEVTAPPLVIKGDAPTPLPDSPAIVDVLVPPSHGKVEDTPQGWVYIPHPGFTGHDSVTVLDKHNDHYDRRVIPLHVEGKPAGHHHRPSDDNAEHGEHREHGGEQLAATGGGIDPTEAVEVSLLLLAAGTGVQLSLRAARRRRSRR
ncbi:SdrD B-like domain-containing protein [Streptacidiphilus fuscans]|uniref:SD-repeat containing protein B domain-containing protein n=1 Tax=Streptacidiphilus fuscans TaxID=2789292 RepID=A0A931BAK0_9ACTN|nr:SdrD B-like domain-containing protein [Streptacidiphilus fuscans]MBF9073138.1 hypothetical protein [Streptacidiphilus fuscans]